MDIEKELDNILNDPLLEISEQEKILHDIPEDMKQVIQKRRANRDYTAQRKECEDFALFKPLFEQVHEDLKQGRRSLTRLTKTDSYLQEKRFFVMDGMLLYIESVGELTKDMGGKGHNKDARTRCIYENGTESDVLVQSLRRAIYADGYGVTELQETDQAYLEQQMTAGDHSNGFVYVLKSLSPSPEIANVKDLYKIGFTVNSVEERIKNAAKDPTYLMAPVQIIETVEIVNMNSRIFEGLVHQMFSAVQYQVKVYDQEGNLHVPEEWYVVPLEIINLVIKKIADGSIIHYTYNPEMQCLEKQVVKKHSNLNTQGLRVLTLNIKDIYFQEILKGTKTIEYRQIKQTTINKYTYVDVADGKRYLKPYDLIHFFVGYHKDRDSAYVEVLDIKFNEGIVEYYLGRVIEHTKQSGVTIHEDDVTNGMKGLTINKANSTAKYGGD